MSTITLLTRAGCHACERAHADLAELVANAPAGSPAVEFVEIDVDAVAETDPELRAEYGDRLPVVLLDGNEHSYWDVDAPRLRRDLNW
ncbi:glutaredoxin family protein [Jongsikchunia kroppenstedtii]|uniref:glutaredoxin family protein n=1 Tax=Jongsikchunia kroppenstedtii TaxID=1121721 RepID=UPI000365B0D6|nr:glutaredoxin family protein [Jongsikchunia kroppenstedtii]